MPELPNTTLKPADSKVSPPVGGGGVGFKILVFKTNLSTTDHIGKVTLSLNHHPYILEWNVDLHDCDKVLRVVSQNLQAKEVEQIIFNAGYYCRELV